MALLLSMVTQTDRCPDILVGARITKTSELLWGQADDLRMLSSSSLHAFIPYSPPFVVLTWHTVQV